MIWLALLAQAGLANTGYLYLPSPDQARIDRSFSMIAIDTPLILARARLKAATSGDCAITCDWIDRDGVRYSFRGETAGRQYLVAKTVRATDYVWKAIPALGIGQARDRALVIAAVQRQVRGLRLDCAATGASGGTETCRADLKPGWITLAFQADGKLIEATLVGYPAP